MALIKANYNPSRKDLRIFGILFLVFVGLLSASLYRKGYSTTWVGLTGGAAAIAGLLGVVAPGLLKCVYIASVWVTYPLGFVISHAMVTLIFYGVVTPIGLLMRIAGNDPMRRSWSKSAKTYWDVRDQPQTLKRYLRQY